MQVTIPDISNVKSDCVQALSVNNRASFILESCFLQVLNEDNTAYNYDADHLIFITVTWDHFSHLPYTEEI